MAYEVHVDFDDERADIDTSKKYFDALRKYDAIGMGHEKTRTSSMFIESDKLDVKELKKGLGNILVISVKRI